MMVIYFFFLLPSLQNKIIGVGILEGSDSTKGLHSQALLLFQMPAAKKDKRPATHKRPTPIPNCCVSNFPVAIQGWEREELLLAKRIAFEKDRERERERRTYLRFRGQSKVARTLSDSHVT